MNIIPVKFLTVHKPAIWLALSSAGWAFVGGFLYGVFF